MEIRSKRVIEDVKRICDICGKKEARKTCSGCKKDLCTDHIVWWEHDPWTGESNGDDPQVVCPSCEEKSLDLSLKAREILRKADGKLEALCDEWRKRCAE